MTATDTVAHRRLLGARVLRDGRAVYWWGEIVAVVVYYVVYSAIRNHSNASKAHAFDNAKRLIRVEEWLQRGALHRVVRAGDAVARTPRSAPHNPNSVPTRLTSAATRPYPPGERSA